MRTLTSVHLTDVSTKKSEFYLFDDYIYNLFNVHIEKNECKKIFRIILVLHVLNVSYAKQPSFVH